MNFGYQYTLCNIANSWHDINWYLMIGAALRSYTKNTSLSSAQVINKYLTSFLGPNVDQLVDV